MLTSLIKKDGVHALFQITSGKLVRNDSVPCLKNIDFVVIPSYIELWFNLLIDSVALI